MVAFLALDMELIEIIFMFVFDGRRFDKRSRG